MAKKPKKDPLAELHALIGSGGSGSRLAEALKAADLEDLVEDARAARRKKPKSGPSWRTRHYLVTLKRSLDDGLMQPEHLEIMGWSKARVVAQDALVSGKKVTKATARAVAQSPIGAFATDTSPAFKKRLTITLTEAQHRTVLATLAAFGAPPGSSYAARAKALLALCKAAKGFGPGKGS